MLLSPQILIPTRGALAAVVAGYTGPGDIVSGATGWWGLRGYSAAVAATGTQKSIQVVDQAGSNPLDVVILTSGSLDTASISTWVTANTVSTIHVKKIYDQTGNAHDLSQATTSQMPVLTLSAIGSLPAMTFTGANSQFLADAGTITRAPVYSFSTVAKSAGNASFAFILGFGAGGNDGGIGLDFNGADNFFLTAADGGAIVGPPTANDNTWFRLQAVNNGATANASIATVNGTDTTGTLNTAGYSGATFTMGAQSSGGRFINAQIGECGFWPSAFSSGNRTSLDSNQSAYWGV